MIVELCEHGKWEAHKFRFSPDGFYGGLFGVSIKCPGGRVPTVEEVMDWLIERDTGGLRISWDAVDER